MLIINGKKLSAVIKRICELGIIVGHSWFLRRLTRKFGNFWNAYACYINMYYQKLISIAVELEILLEDW